MSNSAQDNKNNILYQLVREEVNSNAVYDSNSEVMVITDGKGGAYTKKPGALSFFASYRYFIVNTARTITSSDYLCTLNRNGSITNINIDYKLKCLPLGAEKLALRIASSTSPLILNNLLQQAIDELDSQLNLSVDFFTKKSVAESVLSARLKDIGLTAMYIDLQTGLKGSSAKQLTLDVRMFKAQLKDCSPKAALGLSAGIKARAGMEALAASQNISEESAEGMVLGITKKELSESVTPQTLYDNLHSTVRAHIMQLVNEALEPYGCELSEYTLSLHKQGVLDSIVIETPGFIDVRVKESHQVLKLKYKCELVTAAPSQAEAYLFAVNMAEISAAVENKVKATLADEVTIEEFSDAIKTVVPVKIAAAISEALAKWGRRAGFLELEHDRKLPPRDVEIKHVVECTTKDGYQVTVSNTLLLQRDYNSHKVFEASQVEDFNAWGKAELDRITKNFIITNTYNQLLYDLQDAELRQQMQKEAEKIGYLINHLITVPEFEGITRPERFKVEYKNTELSSKADGLPLAISVYAEGRLMNFKKIIDLLAPAEALSASIHNAIDARVAQFFHSVEPERFYNRFYVANAEKADKAALAEEIRQIVKNVLADIYDAEAGEITVNQLDTKLIQRLKQLQQGVFTCDFTDRNRQFSFRSRISVLSVDPQRWEVFNSKGYKPRSEDPTDTERKDIANLIREFMGNALDTRIIPLASQGELNSMYEFLNEVKNSSITAQVKVKEYFGLVVDIDEPVIVKDKMASSEDAIKDELREMYLLQRKERLRILYAQRKEKENSHPVLNDPGMKRIQEEIDKIEADILPGKPAATRLDTLAKLLDSSTKQNLLTDNQ